MVIIDGFTIDVATAEGHLRDAEVTKHPVEDGADIADHVRPKPIVINVEGIVSDTPIEPIASQRQGETLPSEQARAKLTALHAARSPITLTTSTGTYSNMILRTLDEPVDAQTGDAYRFRAVFEQIAIVSNNRIFVPVAIPRAQRKRSLGNKSPKTTPDKAPAPSPKAKETYQSWLKEIF